MITEVTPDCIGVNVFTLSNTRVHMVENRIRRLSSCYVVALCHADCCHCVLVIEHISISSLADVHVEIPNDYIFSIQCAEDVFSFGQEVK